jgi:methionyl-tRNA formyltransferase
MKHTMKVVDKLVSDNMQVAMVAMKKSIAVEKNITATGKDVNKEAGLEVYYEDDCRLKNISRELEVLLCKEEFDVCFCLSWHWVISKEFINRFKYGVFGWHGSMFKLPHGFGRSPINWSIRLGAKEIYHTCFKYTSISDHGPIYSEKKIYIDEYDHIGDILEKSTDLMYLDITRLIKDNGNIKLINRGVNTPIYFEKLTELSGEVILDDKDLSEITNIVRSCSDPFPKAYIEMNDGYKIRLKRILKRPKRGCLVLTKKDKTSYLDVEENITKKKLEELNRQSSLDFNIYRN